MSYGLAVVVGIVIHEKDDQSRFEGLGDGKFTCVATELTEDLLFADCMWDRARVIWASHCGQTF